MTNVEKARKRIERELTERGITYQVGALGGTIWTVNCTIEIYRKSIEVNEVETPLEDVISTVLAIENGFVEKV